VLLPLFPLQDAWGGGGGLLWCQVFGFGVAGPDPMQGRHKKMCGGTAPVGAVVQGRVARATSAGQADWSSGAVGAIATASSVAVSAVAASSAPVLVVAAAGVAVAAAAVAVVAAVKWGL
jgi:hypothetical protein